MLKAVSERLNNGVFSHKIPSYNLTAEKLERYTLIQALEVNITETVTDILSLSMMHRVHSIEYSVSLLWYRSALT